MAGYLKASQIPKAVLREIKGLPKRKSAKSAALADIPPGWRRCEGHGWYASGGTCPYCEGDMYLQLDEDYFGHPKTLNLMTLMGPEADTYPPRMWVWAKKYAKDGAMKDVAMVEQACRWRGTPGQLAQALVAVGFLDPDLSIHNWMKRTGRDIASYEMKKERARGRRTGTFQNIPEHSGNIPEDSRKSPALGEERRGEESKEDKRRGEEKPLPGTVLGLLLHRARKANIPNNPDTLRRYLEAWIDRSDAGRVEQVLMDPWTKGKTVNEIQDHFFGNAGGSWDGVLGGPKA